MGEAFELELENLLRGKFPLDLIEPVAKGETGGDIVHTVNGQIGVPAGVILWELKNTKNWSDAWLPKLRDNKPTAKADIALIVSTALPKSVETFDLIDGVYVAHPSCAIPGRPNAASKSLGGHQCPHNTSRTTVQSQAGKSVFNWRPFQSAR
jgi:hypothetical protein